MRADSPPPSLGAQASAEQAVAPAQPQLDPAPAHEGGAPQQPTEGAPDALAAGVASSKPGTSDAGAGVIMRTPSAASTTDMQMTPTTSSAPIASAGAQLSGNAGSAADMHDQICYVCFDSEGPLVSSPCACNTAVHINCLEEWLSRTHGGVKSGRRPASRTPAARSWWRARGGSANGAGARAGAGTAQIPASDGGGSGEAGGPPSAAALEEAAGGAAPGDAARDAAATATAPATPAPHPEQTHESDLEEVRCPVCREQYRLAIWREEVPLKPHLRDDVLAGKVARLSPGAAWGSLGVVLVVCVLLADQGLLPPSRRLMSTIILFLAVYTIVSIGGCVFLNRSRGQTPVRVKIRFGSPLPAAALEAAANRPDRGSSGPADLEAGDAGRESDAAPHRA